MAMNQVLEGSKNAGRYGVRRRLPGSVIVWLSLVAVMVLVKLALVNFYPHALADPAQAAFFEWPVLGIFSAVGLAGVLLSQRTGFPDAWDPSISHRQRLLLPILIGLGFGAVSVAADLLTGYSKALVAYHGLAQQYTGFLPMLLAFTAGAILVEVLYRLFPMPLLTGLISNLLLRGRWQGQVFWVLAFILSLWEPLSQDLWATSLGWGMFSFWFFRSFALNFSQAALFRKYGFLASIVMRVAYYLVWHALYVH